MLFKVPISLFHIIDASTVFSFIAFTNSSDETCPLLSTSRNVTSYPLSIFLGSE